MGKTAIQSSTDFEAAIIVRNQSRLGRRSEWGMMGMSPVDTSPAAWQSA